MSSDNPNVGNARLEQHKPDPDSQAHLNKIQDEVRNSPPHKPRLIGINLPFLQFGISTDGALKAGVNLGIVNGEAKVGLVNGADVGVHLGPILDGGAGAYAGVDENGFRGNAGVGVKALGLIGGRGHVDARLGDATGADVGAGANVGQIGARVGAGAGLGDDGFDAAVSGRGRVGNLAGIHTGGHLGLNRDPEVAVDAGGRLGDLKGTVTAGAFSDDGTTFRPDLLARGSAGQGSGVLDLNPPIGYPGEAPCPPNESAHAGASTDSLALSQAPKIGPVDEKPLPPAHEAATPENMARVDREVRTKLSQEAKYIVAKGDTYQSIAAHLLPGADATKVAAEAQKLQKMNEENGYKGLHTGLVLNTEDPYTLDRKTRGMVAEHFGLDTSNI